MSYEALIGEKQPESPPTVEIYDIEWDTAACRHSQNDGSTEYVGLVIHCSIDGHHRRLFLRTSEAQYPGNQAMISLLTKLGKRVSP